MKLTPKQKPYLYGALGALILILLFRKKGGAAAAEAQALQQEAAQGQPTYPNSQYLAWANRLEQAMFDIGTDEDAIFQIFAQLRNNTDFLSLKAAFGIRNYTGGFLPGLVSGDLSLDGWLQQELDRSEIEELNSILFDNGITYMI